PEGYGAQYKLAENLAALAATQTGKTKDETLTRIKQLCRAVEQGESEFTSKARTLKLNVMFEDKDFDKAIEKLTAFDDCYIRAQFEIAQIEKDGKDLEENVKKLEEDIKKLEGEVAKLAQNSDARKTKEAEIQKKQ